MKTELMLGLQSRGDSGDSILLGQTKRLLDAGTPGPVVNALLDDLTDPAYRVVEQAEWDKLNKEIILTRENARTDFRTFRDKSRHELESMLRHLQIVQRSMAKAVDGLNESQKPIRNKKGGGGYYEVQKQKRAQAKQAFLDLAETLRSVEDIVLPQLREMAYGSPMSPTNASVRE